jgi:hypothetical protein
MPWRHPGTAPATMPIAAYRRTGSFRGTQGGICTDGPCHAGGGDLRGNERGLPVDCHRQTSFCL